MKAPAASRNRIRLLMSRLERIPADSAWAHRASGLRRALMHAAEQLEAGGSPDERVLARLTERGFQILAAAARERIR